ncbi:MAG: domain S-box [Ferruginibacter sp.]|nr:domain S-box [Ferruginibacter sp.]
MSENPIQDDTGHFGPTPGNRFSNKKAPLLLAVLTFVILAGLFTILAYQRFLINKVAVQKGTNETVVAAKERLQEILNQGESAAKTLSFFIQKDGAVKDFDSIAAQILASNSGIDVLELVPNGVIRYIYPLKGLENILGYNILKEPSINKEAFKAIEKKELFYAGPFALKQGGMGIVGRLPVFRNNKFWGFSAVVIKMETLWKAAKIDSTSKSGYYFQVSKINPVNNREEFFISNPLKKDTDYPVAVNMANEEWIISATPALKSKGDRDIWGFLIVGYLFSALCGFFVFTVVRKPQKLDQLVRIRTADFKKSEEKYRFLIEQAPDAVLVYSSDGTIHQFNKAAYAATGYTKEEFANLNLKDLLLEKAVIIEQSRADTLNSGKSVTFPRKLYKKDGVLMDVEINVSRLPDNTLLAFVRDATERIAAEKALTESEQKFSRVFQSDLLSLAIYDEHETLVDANDTYAALLETKKEYIIGNNSDESKLLSKMCAKNRAAARANIIEILQQNGQLKNYELQIATRDGRVMDLLLSVEPLDINDRHHWLTAVFDITEKKKATLALGLSEKKYRSLIEQASDGIVISDFAGIILEVNKSICTMGGYDAVEMTGRHIDNFMPKEDIKELPLRIEDLLQGKTLLYERRMQKKDGTVIDVEINSKMAAGNTLIGFVRDITERKKASIALRKSNETYELIAKATTDAIWDHDFITNQTIGNQNLYNLYGFSAGSGIMNFESFRSRLHPDDEERVIMHMQKAIVQKVTFVNDDYRFKTGEGVYKYFYDRAYIVYDDDGAPARMLGVMQDSTERIKAQQKILKEKELSDSIINSLPAIFYLYNRKQQFLRWNRNFETVSGYNAEEITHLPVMDLFDDDKRLLMNQKIENVFISGHDTVEANLLAKDKQQIPYYFTAMRIEYEGEECLMGFGLDFSDKVLSDKRIKDSEQKFRSLVEQATDGVAIRSLDGVPQYVSPSLERMLGYTEAEMLQLNVWDISHPDESKMLTNVLEKAMKHPGIPIKGLVSRVLHKNGSWRWIEDTITNMLHIPEINGIVENLRDVTEKLQIEKKIMTEKELSDSIINSLPGIFYLYDKNGKFIRWNKNFEQISGYNAEEISRMHPLDFYDADEKELIRKRIESNFISRSPGIELHLLTKAGQKIPFYINSLALNYEGLPCIVGMGIDVSDRKTIEQELTVSNQQLEKKATELRTSYSELERFAYIVSHDLQEPLRMVSSFLKLLQQKYKTGLDETALKYIHFAVDGADRMKQLIMDLLEYSRTGTNSEVDVDTDMNEVMTDVLNVLETAICEQKAVVETGNLPTLSNTSKIQMFQVMQNLLSNAIKYRSEKDLAIKIEAKEEYDQWVFSVRDNGIGIDPKFSEKIFIIFQRLHNKTEYSGTGIGLSICKKIVEKHGGKIWVQSEVGAGSTFYFSIPK